MRMRDVLEKEKSPMIFWSPVKTQKKENHPKKKKKNGIFEPKGKVSVCGCVILVLWKSFLVHFFHSVKSGSLDEKIL